ncbi:nuclear pore complex protein Nup133-like [Haliotis cracherodii]|uniref:nuclear pore complex protein Nup133-like n=1 Tax=Haliotis cracherodii TaxID=6455 RepID=UPI0039EB7EB9
MFTPRPTGTRARASPFTPGSQRASQTKRSSGVFTPQSRRLSSLRSHTPSKSNRSLQTSQIVDDVSSQHRVESFGVPLPVLITEALTLADRNTEITVNVDPSGWAWLVGGRKLFVWRYKQHPGTRGVLCKELTLPPSDLAHSAERVCVIPSDNQPAACVAVSPEGVVRYWPNIAYESSTGEVSAELKGEECACVINFQPFGCLLATTTSSLILLTTTPGQNTIMCQPLKAAQGMFAGIGRRMSSFIFGASPMQTMGAPFQAIVPGDEDEEEMSRPFFVLSGTHVQKWEISNSGPEKLLYQVDVDRLFRETLARRTWDLDSVQMPQLRSWLIDMKTTVDGVMLLGAGVNLETDSVVHYALATLSTEDEDPPTALDDFMTLEHTERYEEDTEMDLLDLHLLVPDSTAYVYDKKVIFAKQGVSMSDRLELQSAGDQILGAGRYGETAVFFSSTHGLFCLSSAAKLEQSILEESAQEALSRSEVSTLATSRPQVAEMGASDDKSARLKAAFINSLNGNLPEAQKIVTDLFPLTDAEEELTSEMDKLVTMLSRDLIDDYPTSDPRWAESLRNDSAGSTTSLIILQQLKDKEKAHEYLISFLKRLELWDRLKAVSVRDTMMSTQLLLCEHAEKVAAAVGLRELHSDQSAIVDNCIRRVLESMRDANIPAGLSPADVFYREVSRVPEIVSALLEYEDESLSSDLSPKQCVMIVSSVNGILEGLLHSGLQYRQSRAGVFQGGADRQLEYIPWTSAGGSRGIRTMLTRQYMLTIESAVPEARDIETQGVLFQQLLGLADVLLDGYKSQLVSLQQCPRRQDQYNQLHRKYEQERDKLISPLMDHEQYERAATLAEKYFDFENLVKICELTKNEERLQRYTQQFADKGFSNFLFHWYMKEGKRGRLLSQPIGTDSDLSQFLNSDNTRYLSWLHDIGTNNFDKAHETLFDLAQGETAFLAKKKTLLSLSKLAALAADDPESLEENVEGINDELTLILHQEQLPEEVLETLGMDPANMGVMSTTELIELYVGDKNKMASEYDFKKALDLLQYLDKAEGGADLNDLKLHIWCRAILRDNWTNTADGDPLDVIRETVFFKTIDLAYTEGGDLEDVLPCQEAILSSEELGACRHNSNFQYLIKAGYEHMKNIMA